jgi:hypothetical protein
MVCALAVLASLFVLEAAVEAIGRITRADAYARTAMAVAASVLFLHVARHGDLHLMDPSAFGLPAPAGPGSFSAVPASRSRGRFIATYIACINGCVKIASTQPWWYGGECRVGSAHWSLLGRFSFPVCSLTPPGRGGR